ncbi:HET-domain-containing protein [Hypoxylon trugodes]|uniref:HET-domain-containing protein n=1 Tax=Hypoxylon trugodes TaxID=326681 RepID=UPI00219A06AC|nr:HET-domain-containing protein [Hypoxylon trugodes]KAI1383584.1 HET-domain-containing protein [Hypoxylon trugodes]
MLANLSKLAFRVAKSIPCRRTASISAQECSTLKTPLYAPLSRDQPHVRFIKILPSDTDDQPVSCLLETVRLTPNIRYSALSYVWGDPKVTKDIIVNGVTVPVTTNLESALWHFRKFGFPGSRSQAVESQRLWVDAVCIDQKDIPERNSQVTLMGSIFSNAASVFSWLGHPGADHVDVGLQIVRRIAYETTHVIGIKQGDFDEDPKYHEKLETGFEWLVSFLGPLLDEAKLGEINLRKSKLNRSAFTPKWKALEAFNLSNYWKRIWIIQEMALARSPKDHWFVCGSDAITFEELEAFNSFMRSIYRLPWPGPARYGYFWIVFADKIQLFNPTAMKRITWLKESRRAENPEKPQFLEICLVMKNAFATDPRDYVYGMLGLHANNIVPDYAKPVKEVYLDCVLSDGTANTENICLQYSGRGNFSKGDHDLPSWLPDLSLKDMVVDCRDVRDTNERHDKGLLGADLQPPQIIQRRILRTQGAVCGRVERIKRLRFDSDIVTNSKRLYELSVEYLFEFVGVGNVLDSIEKMPLQELIDVLDWRQKDSRKTVSSFFSMKFPQLKLSVVSWRYLYILFHYGKEMEERRFGLSIPDEGPFHIRDFLIHCLVRHFHVMEDEDEENQKLLWDQSRVELEMLFIRSNGMVLFKTDRGHLGIGPPNLQPGDLVCAVGRCTLPVILRKQESPGVDKLQFEHMGTCYVQGLSDGEPAGMVKRGEVNTEAFDIR